MSRQSSKLNVNTKGIFEVNVEFYEWNKTTQTPFLKSCLQLSGWVRIREEERTLSWHLSTKNEGLDI